MNVLAAWLCLRARKMLFIAVGRHPTRRAGSAGLRRSTKVFLALSRRSAAKVNRGRPNQSYSLRGAPYG